MELVCLDLYFLPGWKASRGVFKPRGIWYKNVRGQGRGLIGNNGLDPIQSNRVL